MPPELSVNLLQKLVHDPIPEPVHPDTLPHGVLIYFNQEETAIL